MTTTANPARKGQISVETSDIFPIIKKWLYSEHDIFLRELVSNATDAISKRKSLSLGKNVSCPTGAITVEVDKKAGTITISDNGLGMTEQEVEKYLAQLAFSGAREFVEKMQDSQETVKDDIIGKFGLGFYSAFMVAKRVEVETLSMEEGAAAVLWLCDGETEYEFRSSDKKDVGTKITLFLNDESLDFLEGYKTRATLVKYMQFMPYPIEFIDREQRQKIMEENLKAKKKEDEKPIEVDIINNSNPPWKNDPQSLKDEDYKNFYRELFPMDQEPLFWLHLNIDHPFTLKGILYFPKLNPTKPMNEGNIKLYSKQVFVSDNIKDIIPEFLSLLKGVIDSPDIPLNVSRSSLQGDPNIQKISNYIVKKVAESLKKIFNNSRQDYEKSWDDIGLFVKYGLISDDKFDQLMRPMVLFKSSTATEGKSSYYTLKEYTETIPAQFQEKMKNKILTTEKDQGDLILAKQLAEQGLLSVEVDQYIDPHLTQHLEFKGDEKEKFQFCAVESEFENLVESENTNAEDQKIADLFKEILIGKDNDKSNELDVEIKKLKRSSAAYFKVDQNMKRFQQMTRSMGNSSFQTPVKKTLVINPQASLIQSAYNLWQKESSKELAKKMIFHVQDLAAISGEGLESNQKEAFVLRSQQILEELSSLAVK